MYSCRLHEEDREKSKISSIKEKRKDYKNGRKAGWAEKYLQENRSHGKAD